MSGAELTNHVTRVEVLRVPLDVVSDGELESVILDLVTRESINQIALLRWWDFMRARWDKEYRGCLRDAALVLPVSRSLQIAARFLKRPVPNRYMPFNLVIRVLGALEDRHRSVYVFGGRPARLRIAEQNLRETFPGLRFIGRYAGFYPAYMERDIITGIRKAGPDLLLAGPGVPGEDRWIYRHRKELDNGICLWSAEAFDIFSERRNRVSRSLFDRSLDFLPDLLRRPWRALRFFVYLWFLTVLLAARLFHR